MMYQKIIREIDPTLTVEEAAGFEGSMRFEYGTLDHLPRSKFRQEICLARMCEEEEGGYLRGVAKFFGLLREEA